MFKFRLDESINDIYKWQYYTTDVLTKIFGRAAFEIDEFTEASNNILDILDEIAQEGPTYERQFAYYAAFGATFRLLHSFVKEISSYWEDEKEADMAPETRLHDQLLATFDVSELKTLCFNLGIDYEILSGENKSDKARELILHCRRHNRTAELLERCRELRPTLLW